MKLKIPTDLSEIYLHQVQRFWVIENNEKISDNMKWLHGVATFANKSVDDLKNADISEIQDIYTQLMELLFKEDEQVELIRFFKYGRVEYGFEPDVRQISTGAFIDLDEYVNDLNKNLHKIMAILYRPVTVKEKQFYQITNYITEPLWQRDHRRSVFLKYMPYSYVRGAVNFFYEAVKKHTNSSVVESESKEVPMQTSKDGGGSTSFTDSPKGTSPKSKRSPKSRSSKPSNTTPTKPS
ncbi:hypothetical protein AMJ86_00850 [bacterium SM23_57]|nr:MAG: hypothetical protein AMJ86_00850 [bacterium SM23_57]